LCFSKKSNAAVREADGHKGKKVMRLFEKRMATKEKNNAAVRDADGHKGKK